MVPEQEKPMAIEVLLELVRQGPKLNDFLGTFGDSGSCTAS